MNRHPRGGFTLIELLVSLALFTIVLAAIASVTSGVLRNQTRLMLANSIDNATTLTRHSLTNSLETATYIASPSSGTITSFLTTWSNMQDDGVTKIVPALPARFSHHCVATGGTGIHYYSGVAPMPLITCGNDYANAFHIILAGGQGYQLVARFYRPLETANLVQADVSLALQKVNGIRRDTSVQVQVITRHATN